MRRRSPPARPAPLYTSQYAGGGLLLVDTLGRILGADEALCGLLGHPHDAMLAMRLADIEPSPDVARARIAQLLDRGADVYSARYRRRDGRPLEVQVRACVLEGPAGARCLAFAVTEVTSPADPRRRELELRELEARFAAIFHASVDAIVISRLADGLIVDVNEAYVRLTGYAREALIGKTTLELGLVADPEGRAARAAYARKHGSVRDVPSPLRTRSGELRHCLQTSYTVRIGGEQCWVSVMRDMTDAKRAEQALHASEERLREVVRVADIGIFDHDHRTGAIYWSPEQRRIYGWSAEEAVTLEKFLACVYSADLDRIRKEVQRAYDPAGDGLFDVEHRIVRSDGELRWLTTRSRTFFEGEGRARRPVRTVGAVQDSTQRKLVDLELQLAAIAFESHEGIFITDVTGRILRANRAFTAITGYPAEEAIGKPASMLASEHFEATSNPAVSVALERSGSWQGEVYFRRKNGELCPVWQSITQVTSEEGRVTHFVCHFQDISERKRVQARAEHLAYHDPLTDLPNRSLLLDRLQQALVRNRRRGLLGAVLFIDLDRFKHINDSLGHRVGDLLLQEVAACVAGQLRSEDTVARLGGDEFVVLLSDLGQSRETAPREARALADKILQAISRDFNVAGYALRVAASIGVAVFPDGSEKAEDILRHADIAMYRAKAAGRGSVSFYSPDMQAAARQRLQLEGELRQASEKGQFVLHFQPQVQIASGKILGAESLLRWAHPQRGLLAPAMFIPVLEESGLIIPVGDWVLRAACQTASHFAPSGRELKMTVNVSPRQLHQASFAQRVRDILAECGSAPETIELEITESAVIQDVDVTVQVMSALKDLGVRFSLDDFGTGYSSLSYVKRLPLDTLKIDRTFVRDCTTDPNDAAIVRAIIAMARSLELDVVAEGIENEVQLNFLSDLGCAAYQGYLFSAALPEAQFLTAVRGGDVPTANEV